MSLKESTTAVALAQAPAQQQLYTKLKLRSTTKEVDSPKSVISDPRIVSPASSASASLERRLNDLKKVPRHDRVYSISDADDENVLPAAVNLTAVLTRQLSAKDRERERNGLEAVVSEAHPLPSVPARMGLTSGPPSETSSPRNRIGRSVNKDGAKYIRASDSEFLTRRLAAVVGADSTSSSGPLPHPTEHGVEKDAFTFAMPKSLEVCVLDKNLWRSIAGVRSLTSKASSREPLPASKLSGEDGLEATSSQSVSTCASNSSSREEPSNGSMYDMLVTNLYGPLEQVVSGKGRLRRSGVESCIKDCSIVQIGCGLAHEDQIEFHKFVVRCGSNGDEIKAREPKMLALPLRSSRGAQGPRKELGDGRSGVASYRHKTKSLFSPGDSPGHAPSFGDWSRSAMIELSSDVVVKETSKLIKEFPEIPYAQKDGGGNKHASSIGSDAFDSIPSIRLAEGRRKSDGHVSSGTCLMFPLEGHGYSSLQAMPTALQQQLQTHGNGNSYSDGHYDKNHQQGGSKYPGFGETIKTGLVVPQQRLVPGQFLKANPLNPRPQPAKWDDAEKWLMSPSTVRSTARSQYGNGPLSGGSTPQHHISQQQQQHISQGRHQSLRSSPGNNDILQPSVESYEATLIPDDHGVVGGGNSFLPTPASRAQASVDAATTTTNGGRDEQSLLADVKRQQSSDASSNGDAAVARPEGNVHPIPDGALVKANLLLVASKLARERSERGPGEDFFESKELQEPLKKSPSGCCTSVDTATEQASFDQKHDAFSATIFDNFTKDKFADSITVQSTSPNNGRLVIVMKDAATEITPSTSQRDIATQISPVQSFHAAVTPPRLHTGPARLNTTPVHSERRTASVGVDVTELQNCHQAKLELDQAAALDTNWTTREEEVEESAKSLRLSVDFKEVKKNVLEARAAAWEEAEQSKYMSRYHREEAKILAWEAHQKAKAEAEMRKMEVKLERMRSHANEILQNKIASVHLRAENMRAAAAAACGEQAAKTNQWAQEIRTSGRSPGSPILCCFPSCFSS